MCGCVYDQLLYDPKLTCYGILANKEEGEEEGGRWERRECQRESEKGERKLGNIRDLARFQGT